MPVATNCLVGMAEAFVVKGSGQFTCLGLGSCIGLAVLDPVAKVAGMAHIMLPEAFAGQTVDRPAKFADTGVAYLFELFEREGGSKRRCRVAIAGGAQVFKFGDGTTPRLDIGSRNVLAVVNHLAEIGLRPQAQETGGANGRTMIFGVDSGEIRIRTVSQGERELCNLAA